MRETINSDTHPTGPRRARVLVAENDEAMRILLVNALKRLGYNVQEIGSSAEMNRYLAVFEKTDRAVQMPDLIISGITMPGKTAIDNLKALKERLQSTPVVLITTMEDSRIREQALRLGAAAVFDKPFNTEMLKEFLLGTIPPLSGSQESSDAQSEHRSEAPLIPGPNIA